MMVKETIKALIFRTGTRMGGVLCFFQTLFLVLLLYIFMEYIFRKTTRNNLKIILLQTFCVIVFLLAGYWCYIHSRSINGLNHVFSVYSLIHLGRLMKRYKIMDYLLEKCNGIILSITALLILIAGYYHGYISLVGNEIEPRYSF